MRHTLETAKNSTGSTNTVSDHEKIAAEFCYDCISAIRERLGRMEKLQNMELILSSETFNQMCSDLAGICHIAINIIAMDKLTKNSKLPASPYGAASTTAAELRGKAYKIYGELQPLYPVGPMA